MNKKVHAKQFLIISADKEEKESLEKTKEYLLAILDEIKEKDDEIMVDRFVYDKEILEETIYFIEELRNNRVFIDKKEKN